MTGDDELLDKEIRNVISFVPLFPSMISVSLILISTSGSLAPNSKAPMSQTAELSPSPSTGRLKPR